MRTLIILGLLAVSIVAVATAVTMRKRALRAEANPPIGTHVQPTAPAVRAALPDATPPRPSVAAPTSEAIKPQPMPEAPRPVVSASPHLDRLLKGEIPQPNRGRASALTTYTDTLFAKQPNLRRLLDAPNNR